MARIAQDAPLLSPAYELERHGALTVINSREISSAAIVAVEITCHFDV
jgi:hypothetical protein